jgi:hypothetical protein
MALDVSMHKIGSASRVKFHRSTRLPSSKDLAYTRIVSRSGSNFKLSSGAMQRCVETGKSIWAGGVFSDQNAV